ncbi:DUF4350 domain-containing protein [Luteipulveratus flavus]|uniref:DUF4350 domain-containing protein n=1 Tax=Luteipulveratus flavus TaxID=3031728 RepID=A0ABT6C2B3_9MICO|nr:DUF4350 domain-containing protein [Luteipulveratus sp. YIM 133296]MDF8263059.1 DUF4350 domain-containing protein [Luteipulveratus sp. YIM 133296]
MTATLAPASGTAGSEPRPRPRLPRKRALLGVLAALVVAGLATLLLLGTRTTGIPLDPDNPAPAGGQAMARVLDQQGVDVTPVRTRDALQGARIDASTTVVVTRGSLMTTAMWRELLRTAGSADRLVLVAPGSRALTALDAPLSRRSGTGFGGSTPAACDAPVARGLSVGGGDERYDPTSGADVAVCFRPGGGFGAGGDNGGYLAVLPRTADRPEVVLLGSTETIRNADVRDADNAAVGLRTLGHSPRLVWWSVSPSDVDLADAEEPVFPAWLAPVTVVLALAVLVLMLVRGRRLGRLVNEPLPVVVRANETTRSRGRLYRRAGDRDRASAVLRAGTRRRLTRYLGVPRGAGPAALVENAAATTGRDPRALHDLLYGAGPATEDAFVQLANQLSQLEKEVRHR